MSRKFAKQSAVAAATKLLVAMGGFLSATVIARALGPSGNGIYVSIFAVVGIIITLADMGVRQSLTTLTGQQKMSDRSLVGSLQSLALTNGFAAMAIVGLLLFFNGSFKYGTAVVLFALFTIPLNLYSTYSRGIFLGKGWVGLTNAVDFLRAGSLLVYLGILLFVVKAGVIGMTMAFMLTGLTTASFAFWHMRKVSAPHFDFDRKRMREIGMLGIKYAIALFFITINYRIDVIILTHMLKDIPGGATAQDRLGFYAVGVSVAEALWQLPTALGMVLMSRSARSQESNEAVRRAITVLRVSVPIVIVLSVVLWFATPLLISLLFGAKFLPATEATRMLLPGILAGVIFKILNADLAGRGKPLFALSVYALVVPINIILNIALIPRMGIVGSALASTITYTMGAFYFLFLYCREEGVSMRDALIARKSDFRKLRKSDASAVAA